MFAIVDFAHFLLHSPYFKVSFSNLNAPTSPPFPLFCVNFLINHSYINPIALLDVKWLLECGVHTEHCFVHQPFQYELRPDLSLGMVNQNYQHIPVYHYIQYKKSNKNINLSTLITTPSVMPHKSLKDLSASGRDTIDVFTPHQPSFW